MQVQLIRSATVKITAAGATLLVDPYLAAKGGGKCYAGTLTSPLVELPLALSEVLNGVDAVFVSHLHSDHFDTAAQALLPKDMPMLCPASIAPRLREFGFGDVTAIDSALRWCGCTITLTGGRHGPDDEIVEAMGAVNGFVLAAPGEPTLYWAGDTIWCAEVQAEIERWRPDAIVVHACGATWRGRGPLVMDEAHVAAVLRAAPRAAVVATHLDVVDHATVTREQLRRWFERCEPELARRLRVPADGEVLAFAEG